MSNTRSTITTTTPAGTTGQCAKLVIDTVAAPFVLSGICKVAGSYVFTAWIKAEKAATVQISNISVDISTTWTRVIIPITKTAKDTQNVAIYFNTVTTYYLYKCQVEMGNKSTKWQPSPQDVDEAINTVDSGYKSAIEKTNSQISSIITNNTVDGTKIVSLINQTPDNVTIQANSINLNGVVTANENFKVLKDGSIEAKNANFSGDIIDAKGNKIVSTSGLKTQLMFVGAGLLTAGLFAEFGFYVSGMENNANTYAKQKYHVPFSIPSNFVVDSAVLYCTICSEHWTNRNIYGFPHPIAIYLDTRNSVYLSHSALSETGSSYLNDNVGSLINNAWSNGATTWTANCANGFNTDNANSINLKDYIKSGVSGSINLLVTDSTQNNDTYAEQRTGLGAAYLLVSGQYVTTQ